MNPNDAVASSVQRTPQSEPIRIAVQSLFAGRSEIVLVHNDEEYRLRITSRGKLILTK